MECELMNRGLGIGFGLWDFDYDSTFGLNFNYALYVEISIQTEKATQKIVDKGSRFKPSFLGSIRKADLNINIYIGPWH